MQETFNILVSYDPSHWDDVVADYGPLIHLTGHTMEWKLDLNYGH